MRKHDSSLQQILQQMIDLQQQINRREEALNIEIGAWIRQQTNLDLLHCPVLIQCRVCITRKHKKRQDAFNLYNEERFFLWD